jgi:uncharacterized protein YraI
MVRWIKFLFFLLIGVYVIGLGIYAPARQVVHAQQPTGSVPTVTGTPAGALITVYLDMNQIDVYSGPSSHLYPAIGVMLAGQQAPAYHFSEDGNWIQIYYPGVPDSVAWVYAPYVSISRGAVLSKIGSPATPTSASTPTIDPTLAAAFIAPVTSTRLPTFTAAAPLKLPTFADETTESSHLPIGLLIFGFGFIGVLGVLISYLRGL